MGDQRRSRRPQKSAAAISSHHSITDSPPPPPNISSISYSGEQIPPDQINTSPHLILQENLLRVEYHSDDTQPHSPLSREQQATPDFITDSVMQLAITVVQLWFC
ncbi:hypothetical protein NQZ68_037164 [Dissostichus eleginoides]|nr:hypothetical protein NQZ68_037164 [Dissostichus eleginoides]